MTRQVFLGGACGTTTWRRDIAIPALETAGITYYDPQLGLGEWTEARESAEMKAKADADILLFVINGKTRGVASVAEVSYLLAANRPLVLVLEFIQQGTCIDGCYLTSAECDDLNRGRIFVRTMSLQHGVPLFKTVEEAVQYTIRWLTDQAKKLTMKQMQTVLANICFKDFNFLLEPVNGGFHLQLNTKEIDTSTDQSNLMYGRKWFINEYADQNDIVRTAFKAVLTWQEHEVRESFKYQNSSIFGPHFNVEELVALSKQMHHGD